MLHNLVHGEIWLALRQNPMTLAALPAIFYALLRESWPARRPRWPALPRSWTLAFAALLIVFTIARNVPAEPFLRLVPLADVAR
jgi:hypothetical protein